jgi:hypothetical protein
MVIPPEEWGTRPSWHDPGNVSFPLGLQQILSPYASQNDFSYVLPFPVISQLPGSLCPSGRRHRRLERLDMLILIHQPGLGHPQMR